MPVWLMVIGGLFLVGLVVAFVINEWRDSHGRLTDRRGGYLDPTESHRAAVDSARRMRGGRYDTGDSQRGPD